MTPVSNFRISSAEVRFFYNYEANALSTFPFKNEHHEKTENAVSVYILCNKFVFTNHKR